MRPSDIEIGESYRMRSNPRYSYFKAVKILKPKEPPNPHRYIIVKGYLSVFKNEPGITKHFRPVDLLKLEGVECQTD